MLGIVPDSLFDDELSKLEEKKTERAGARVIDKESPGRSKNDLNVPQPIRKIIAEEHLVNGRKSAVALAESLGISHDSVAAYAKGATSPNSYQEPHPELKSHLDKVKDRITTKASSRLLDALESITSEKLNDSKARDAASIAKDMSVVIRNMEPEVAQKNVGPNYIFYAPVMKKESDYEFIDVEE